MFETSISIENNYFGGEHNIKATYNMILLIHFYVFEMAVAFAFLSENAVEAT